METIGFRRFVLVMAVLALIGVAELGAIWRGDPMAAVEVLERILFFAGGFAAAVLGTRGQDKDKEE